MASDSDDPQGIVALSANIHDLVDILDVIMRKYPMPGDTEDFIQQLREELYETFMLAIGGEYGRNIHETAQVLFKIEDTYHPPLNTFFNFSDKTKCAVWWDYYIWSFMDMRTQLVLIVDIDTKEYKYLHFWKDVTCRPDEDLETVDRNFVYNKRYVLPHHDMTQQLQCTVCEENMWLDTNPCCAADSYPTMATLVKDENVRHLPVCSHYCHNVVTQLENMYKKDEKNIEHKTEKDHQRNCDFCQKDKTDGNLLRCSKCLIQLYCSKECQVKDWPQHKIECKKTQKQTKNENV